MKVAYLRVKQESVNLTVGKLYPCVAYSETGACPTIKDDAGCFRFCHSSSEHLFDKLPPDNGLGWVKWTRSDKAHNLTIGKIYPVTSLTDDAANFNNDLGEAKPSICRPKSNWGEYIPPYSDSKSFPENVVLTIKEPTPAVIEQVKKEIASRKNIAAERDQPGINEYKDSLNLESLVASKTNAIDQGEKYHSLMLANNLQERAIAPRGNGRW